MTSGTSPSSVMRRAASTLPALTVTTGIRVSAVNESSAARSGRARLPAWRTTSGSPVARTSLCPQPAMHTAAATASSARIPALLSEPRRAGGGIMPPISAHAPRRTSAAPYRALTGHRVRHRNTGFSLDLMPDPAIEIRNVAKRYDAHVAIRDLSLVIPRGSVYGLLGPNGAGKTTTIRMILDIIEPDSGTITVLGSQHRDRSIQDRVGYLPEERGLYRKMQVRIIDWTERLGLRTPEKDWGLAKVDELSRGMQQKVQFIGALLHDPELVILDEPFSGLDPVNSQALKDTVVDLRRRGRTVIFSTHIMDHAERLCDAVAIIARGEKVLDGAVNEVRASHGERTIALALDGDASPAVKAILGDASMISESDDSNRFYELELAPGADAGVLLRRLVESGAPIRRFERVQPSLHAIFLDKVGATGVEAGMSGHG